MLSRKHLHGMTNMTKKKQEWQQWPTYTMKDCQASPHRGHTIWKDQADDGTLGHLHNGRLTTVQECGVQEFSAKPQQFEKG
jgi:hypothetical protein